LYKRKNGSDDIDSAILIRKIKLNVPGEEGNDFDYETYRKKHYKKLLKDYTP